MRFLIYWSLYNIEAGYFVGFSLPVDIELLWWVGTICGILLCFDVLLSSCVDGSSMVMDYKLSAKKVVLFPLNLKRPKMTQSNHNKKKEESRKKEEHSHARLIQSNPVSRRCCGLWCTRIERYSYTNFLE
jgi:hypothetical protein